MSTVFFAVLHVQSVGLCRRLEFLVVVGVPPTAILYAILIIEIVYHGEGAHFFSGPGNGGNTMAFKYKIDVIAALKEDGFNTNRIRPCLKNKYCTK